MAELAAEARDAFIDCEDCIADGNRGEQRRGRRVQPALHDEEADVDAPLQGSKAAAWLEASTPSGRIEPARPPGWVGPMPGHLAAHFAAGRHTHGVALLLQGYTWSAYIEDLLILWSTSEAEEWIDGTIYLPL